jgi:hypothetical protein
VHYNTARRGAVCQEAGADGTGATALGQQLTHALSQAARVIFDDNIFEFSLSIQGKSNAIVTLTTKDIYYPRRRSK